MMVLTRRPGERVEIEGVGTLVVVSVEGNKVRLGFEMPRSVGLSRREPAEGWQPPAKPAKRQKFSRK